LLHDGGGDRTATVAALPLIIEALRADGYRFVTISELVGQTGEAVMPHAANGGAPAFVLQQAGFSIMPSTERALMLLFVSAIGLAIGCCELLISEWLRLRLSKAPAAA